MPPPASPAATLAQRLLDAQVAFHLDRFTGDRLESTVVGLVESLLDSAGPHQLADLIDREAVAAVVLLSLIHL